MPIEITANFLAVLIFWPYGVGEMPNKHVINRLEAIRSVLLKAHEGGAGLTAPMIGSERESFINLRPPDIASVNA